MALLQKMGWRPGEGLGKNKEGTLEPLQLEIKMDKKGEKLCYNYRVVLCLHRLPAAEQVESAVSMQQHLYLLKCSNACVDEYISPLDSVIGDDCFDRLGVTGGAGTQTGTTGTTKSN